MLNERHGLCALLTLPDRFGLNRSERNILHRSDRGKRSDRNNISNLQSVQPVSFLESGLQFFDPHKSHIFVNMPGRIHKLGSM